MKPLFPLKDSGLVHPCEDWVGRTVLDTYYRAFGQIADILIEQRSVDEAAVEDGDPRGWTVRPVYAIVRLGRHWLSRLLKRQVLLPMEHLADEGSVLKAEVDRDALEKLAA